jgi:hypothetical protein
MCYRHCSHQAAGQKMCNPVARPPGQQNVTTDLSYPFLIDSTGVSKGTAKDTLRVTSATTMGEKEGNDLPQFDQPGGPILHSSKNFNHGRPVKFGLVPAPGYRVHKFKRGPAVALFPGLVWVVKSATQKFPTKSGTLRHCGRLFGNSFG